MRLIYTILFSLTVFFGQAQIGNVLNKVKKEAEKVVGKEGVGEDKMAMGLKEALNKGVEKAVSTLSAEGGYLNSQYKVLIPKDAQRVINVVKKVPGFENVEETLIEKMNQAAEIAAKKATPIFIDAITSMTIADASNILFGDKDAATRYLEKTSRKALYNAFMPVIQSSLDEVNARSYWKTVMNAYNKVPFQKKINPELDDHVNTKSLDGLFALIEKKEAGIRSDKMQRTNQILKDVFSQLD